MKKKLLIIAVFLISICGILIADTAPAAAAPSVDSPQLRKALLEGVYKCYINNKIKPSLGTLSKYINYESIIQSDSNGNYISLPQSYTSINDDGLNCKQLLNGYPNRGSSGNNSFEGLFYLAGIAPPVNNSSQESKDEFLTKMGYGRTDNSDGQCIAFHYYSAPDGMLDGYGYSQDQYTYNLCASSVVDGMIMVNKLEVVKEGGIEIIEFEIGTDKITLDCAPGNGFSKGGCGTHKFNDIGFGKTSWQDLTDRVLSDIAANKSTYSYSVSLMGAASWTFKWNLTSNIKRTPYGTTNASYDITSQADAANAAIKYLSGNKYDDKTDLRFTEAEQVVLYQTYLEKYYNADIRCNQEGDALTILNGQGYLKVRVWANGAFNTECYAKAQKNGSKSVNGLTSTRYFHQSRSFAELVAALNASTAVTTLSPLDGAGDIGDTTTDLPPGAQNPNQNPNQPPEPKKDTCFDGGEALGWILCPLLTATSKAVEYFYEEVIEKFLQIRVETFSFAGTDNPVLAAWSVFQAMGNIAFIILLITVVFSQLTGVGIDNYGVKKILPKLIIAALLINLSYIVCQIAIDLSNIFGVGLKSLFDTISESIPGVQLTAGIGAAASGKVSVITTIIAILAGAIGIAFIATNGLAVLIPLILSLVSAAIGIIFIFILLSARQAGVVILTVISPLAFACYILPNTQKLFDRWLKMFIGLLMFFPICGLLVGAGGLVSTIILATAPEDFFMALTAMIIGIVPLFFLPTLLKSSFAAMGNIGAKISGFGSGLNKRVGAAAKPALTNSRFGQFATRGQKTRQWRRNQIAQQKDKASIDAEKQIMQGAYTGSSHLKRARSRINESRASSTNRLWGTNNAAFNREKRYRHMTGDSYDGSIGKVDENMQLQGLLGGSVFQSDSRQTYREEKIGTGRFDDEGKEIMRTLRHRTGNAVNTNNTFEAHRGGMTSAASQGTFDKYIADMNSNDINDAGTDFDNTAKFYREMSELGSGATAGYSIQQQAEAMHDSYMERYRTLGFGEREAREQVDQQLGFTRENAGSTNEYTLHQIKDEALRRSGEMNKRRNAADKEATIQAIGQQGTNNAPAGGGDGGGGGGGGAP